MRQGISRRGFLKTCGLGLSAASLAGCVSFLGSRREGRRPNVLFIAVDDMNDWIGPLANHLPRAKTPNLDRLSKKGVTFTSAHCAGPVCHPSRVSVMTGVHPSRSGIINNVFTSQGQPTWRTGPDSGTGALEDVVTLSQHFRDHGYKAYGVGKIYHALQWWDGSECPAEDWDEYYPSAQNPIPKWVRPELIPDAEAGLTRGRPLGDAHLFGAQPLQVPEEQTSDYKVVQWAVSKLQGTHEDPFFLACGIFRPHIPWEVPQKYFDMYPLDQIQLPPHQEGDLKDAFSHGRENWHRWVLENDYWEILVQGYLASITYADAQLGRLLDGFERSAYADNTIVVLWSDHGMHIGEKENWEKFTLWEESTRVPFFFVAPGLTRAGSRCACPVSLIDAYPTLCDLAGLPIPKQCDGESLVPLLEDVTKKRSAPAVTSFGFPRRVVGHSVRAERWRYIKYSNGFEELYDHSTDIHEYTNLAGDAQYAEVIAELARYVPAF
jgi:arylsulfatase A-like enzyme